MSNELADLREGQRMSYLAVAVAVDLRAGMYGDRDASVRLGEVVDVVAKLCRQLFERQIVHAGWCGDDVWCA